MNEWVTCAGRNLEKRIGVDPRTRDRHRRYCVRNLGLGGDIFELAWSTIAARRNRDVWRGRKIERLPSVVPNDLQTEIAMDSGMWTELVLVMKFTNGQGSCRCMEWKSAKKTDAGLFKIPKRWLRIHYYEALNILFRFENSLRVFVYAILKNEFRERWQDCNVAVGNADPQTIKGIAARRMGQAESFGYLGFEIRAPLMHLTSGELIELLTSDAYWPKFKRHFRGDKGIMKNKLLEIGSIRNSLAHFRPIKPDDIEVVKQNSRHTLIGVESCLGCLFSQGLRVPTNTTDEWYKAVSTLGTKYITTVPYFSVDESWINVVMTFQSPILERSSWTEKYFSYQLIKLNPANILGRYPMLRKHVTYVSERLGPPNLDASMNLSIKKDVHFVFSRDVLTSASDEIARTFGDVLRETTEECELLLQDNLAGGQLVEATAGTSYYSEKTEREEGHWTHLYDSLLQPYESTHPDEYWGQHLYAADVVAGRSRYPWMPEDISDREGAFDWMD